MTEKKIHVKIVTHEKVVYEDDVNAVYAKGVQGMFGVLPGHVPFMSSLDIGVTKLELDNHCDCIATMGGVFQMKENEVIILTDMAENGSDIDIHRATEAKERAKELLKRSGTDIDVQRAELALARAIARISAKKGIM